MRESFPSLSAAQRFAPQAMWVAANCGRPMHGLLLKGGAWHRVGTIYWIGIMAQNLGAFGARARSFPSGSTTEMWVAGGELSRQPSAANPEQGNQTHDCKWAAVHFLTIRPILRHRPVGPYQQRPCRTATTIH